jgi:hypothetical protein
VGSDVAGADLVWSDLAVDYPGSLTWSDVVIAVLGGVAVLYWRWGARQVVGVAAAVLRWRGGGSVGLGA